MTIPTSRDDIILTAARDRLRETRRGRAGTRSHPASSLAAESSGGPQVGGRGVGGRAPGRGIRSPPPRFAAPLPGARAGDLNADGVVDVLDAFCSPAVSTRTRRCRRKRSKWRRGREPGGSCRADGLHRQRGGGTVMRRAAPVRPASAPRTVSIAGSAPAAAVALLATAFAWFWRPGEVVPSRRRRRRPRRSHAPTPLAPTRARSGDPLFHGRSSRGQWGHELAAWQIDVTDPEHRARIVGVEGGESAAYAGPPAHDPRALQRGTSSSPRIPRTMICRAGSPAWRDCTWLSRATRRCGCACA